jgi:hypothetical protein
MNQFNRSFDQPQYLWLASRAQSTQNMPHVLTWCFRQITDDVHGTRYELKTEHALLSPSNNEFLELAVKFQKKEKYEFPSNHVYSVNCNSIFSSKFRQIFHVKERP